MTSTLETQFTTYLKAIQEGNPGAMLPFMHPEVVRSVGGKERFLKFMTDFHQALGVQEDARRMIHETCLEKIGPVQAAGPSHQVAYIQWTAPLYLGGKKILDMVASSVALSKDEEKTWVFVECTDAGLALLKKAEGKKLRLPPRPKLSLRIGNQEDIAAGTELQFRKMMLSSALDATLQSIKTPTGLDTKAERKLRAQFLDMLKPRIQTIFAQRYEKKWAKLYFDMAWKYLSKGFLGRSVPPAAEDTKQVNLNVEALLPDLFKELVPFAFSIFDSYLPNESPAWKKQPGRHLNTRIPEYDLTFKDAQIKIDCEHIQLTGSPSGFLGLLGGLWGVARGKMAGEIPCVRFIYQTGVMMPDGDFLIKEAVKKFPDHFISVVRALNASGSKAAAQEARLLLYHLVQTLQYDTARRAVFFAQLESAFSKKTFQEVSGFQHVPDASATTHQAVIKKLAKSAYLTSKDPFHRYLLLQDLHGHIHDTGSNRLRVLKIFSAFLPLLTDPHPLVRDLMAETVDMFVSRLFYDQEYEAMLPLLTQLIDRGINLDINLARRWECRLALGKEEEARQDWERLRTIVKPWEPAPPQSSGLHTTYPHYEFWKLFGYLRLAKKKGTDDFVAPILKELPTLIEESNAFEVGPIFAELQVDIADVKKENIYGKAAGKYVMHSQFVDHILTQGPVDIKTAAIVRSGLYKRIDGRHFVLSEETAVLHLPKMGTAMGWEYRLEGGPLSRAVPTAIHVYHAPPDSPPDARATVAQYEALSYVGLTNAFFWVFEAENERLPGTWTLEITIKLESKPDILLRSSFEIRP